MRISLKMSHLERASGVLLSEALTLGEVAAATALGWAVSRTDVYQGNCTHYEGTKMWCGYVPPVQNLVRDATVGAVPFTCLVSAFGLKYMSADLPLGPIRAPIVAAAGMNSVLVPFVYAPMGAAIGTRIFDNGESTANAAQSAVYGGMIVLGISVGIAVLATLKLGCFCIYTCDDQSHDLEHNDVPSLEIDMQDLQERHASSVSNQLRFDANATTYAT